MGITKFITSFWHFLAILAIKMADFFKARTLLRPSLKTISHDGSADTFGSIKRFLEVPQKGGLKIIVWHFLSDPQKLNLNILNMAWWSIGKNNVFVDTHNFFV